MNLGFHVKTSVSSDTEIITGIYEKVPKNLAKLVPDASEIPNLIKLNQKSALSIFFRAKEVKKES